MFDPEYPPKNRESEELPILRLEIEHGGGTEVFDPNGLFALMIQNPDHVTGLTPMEGRTSHASGRPAISYRSADMRVDLAPEEMLRLLNRSLTPTEYFALRDRFGDAFEWHDDFYDAKTGEALQPMQARTPRP